jgi:Glycosyl transferase family 2
VEAPGRGEQAPVLSVLIATPHGWPAIRPCLERLREQALAAGAEVIVAAGGGPAPPAEALWPGLVWLHRSGLGVFALRALAREVARGAVVAVTEDHCVVAPDWCRRILDMFASHPDAVALKGVVRNGSAERLVDRASYLVSQVVQLPPFSGRVDDAVLGVSCVAYRRAALDRLAPDLAWPVELLDGREWRAAGETVVADERVWVDHHQSLPLLAMSALHYHNARAIAGLRRGRLTARDRARLALLPVLPLVRTVRTGLECRRKGVPWSTLGPSVPLFLWFYLWKGAGELMGYLVGGGDSATRVS